VYLYICINKSTFIESRNHAKIIFFLHKYKVGEIPGLKLIEVSQCDNVEREGGNGTLLWIVL